MNEDQIKGVQPEMKRLRGRSYTTKADVRRVFDGYMTGDYSECHKSRLYNLHGAEYCELLSVVRPYAMRAKEEIA